MWLETLNAMKKASGKTTDQICAESGVPRGTLNKLFAGQTKDPQYSTLKAVVNCLGYTVNDLEPEEKAPETEEPATEVEMYEYLKQLESLLVRKGYIEEGEDISAQDADFLIALLDLIDAHFQNRK